MKGFSFICRSLSGVVLIATVMQGLAFGQSTFGREGVWFQIGAQAAKIPNHVNWAQPNTTRT